MADDFNKVNYDRLFEGQEKPDITRTVSSVGSRIGGILFGLMFGGIALVMTGMLIWASYDNIVESLTYQKTQGIITAVNGTLKDTQIKVKWKFDVQNKTYSGETTATETSEAEHFQKFSSYQQGKTLEILYNPADPQENEIYKPFDSSPIFMLLFLVPFLMIGYMAIMGKFKSGPSGNHVEPESPAIIATIIATVVLCCPAAFIFAFLAEKISPSILLPIFLVYAIVIVPTLIKTIRGKFSKKKTPVNSEEISYSQDTAYGELKSDEQDENLAAITEFKNLSFKKEIGGSLLFAGLWWLIVGIFICIVGYQIYRYAYAKEVFRTTTGTVLSARVESHRGDDSTTYSPEIKYVYNVDAKEYIGKNYELSNSSSSGGWAQRIVDEHPDGKKVTVYYDPSNPSDAVLAMGIPSFAKVCILFLQPFIMVGLGMGYWAISATIGYLKTTRESAVFDPMQLTRRNLWGKPEIGSDSLRILSKNRPSIFIRLIAGYGAACFILIFVAAFKYDFDLSLEQTFLALKAAATVGVAAALWGILKYAFSRPEVFNVDKVTGDISFNSSKENWQLRVDDIKSFRLKEVISAMQNNKPQKDYQLEAVDNFGKAYPVHLFKNTLVSKSQLAVNANHAGQTLANFIGCEMDKNLVASETNKENLEKLKRFSKFLNKMN